MNGPPIVLNAHGVEHDLLRQRAAIESRWPRRLFLRSQLDKLTAFERDACRRAARILACSSEDAAGLARLAPHTPISVVSGVDWKAIGRNLLGVYDEVLGSQPPARVARQR